MSDMNAEGSTRGDLEDAVYQGAFTLPVAPKLTMKWRLSSFASNCFSSPLLSGIPSPGEAEAVPTARSSLRAPALPLAG